VQNVDLKALQVFAVLLKESNVTRAAQQLNMTQSAVSHTLGRLREIFGDPLFISMGRGVVPTERARELAEPLQQTLESMSVLLRSVAPFDPSQHQGTFQIATTDYIGFILLPRLVRRLEQVAPGVELNILPLKPQPDLQALKSGEIDLILWNETSAPPNFYSRKLFADRLKSIARTGHPCINGSLSLEQFCSSQHLKVSSQYGAAKEVVDDLYKQYAIKCQTPVSVPHFILAYILVSQTNLIGMISELVAQQVVKYLPLQILEPPVAVADFTVSQVWHERKHSEAAHRWLRAEIAELAEQIREEQGCAPALDAGDEPLALRPD
jgi:DNA-binding transcriptional LysR family regulator